MPLQRMCSTLCVLCNEQLLCLCSWKVRAVARLFGKMSLVDSEVDAACVCQGGGTCVTGLRSSFLCDDAKPRRQYR
eukprot:6189680-Pleurochrysis_carterae.AAC.2